jgi:hypothetical protein
MGVRDVAGEEPLDVFVEKARKAIEEKHGKSTEELWYERNKRVTDAVNLHEPDRVPVLLNFQGFAASYGQTAPAAAFYSPDEFRRAFIKTALEFEPDISNSPEDNMISGHGLGLMQTTQMHWPGGSLPPDSTLQFIDGINMKAEEYDLFITDPTDFMLRYYLPRRLGALAPLKNTLPPLGQSLGGNVPGFFWMSPLFLSEEFQQMVRNIFKAASDQARYTGGLVVDEPGVMEQLGWPQWFGPGGVCGGFTPGTSQPFDWFADQLRGMRGIVEDMFKRPDKLILACERLLEWRIARETPADPNEKGYPRRACGGVTHWSHDGFLSKKQFETFCWPTWKRALEVTIDLGYVPVVYCEGMCDERVEYFLELPKGKVWVEFERADMRRAKAILGDHTCICAEVPASLIQLGSRQEVEEYCRDLIDMCGEGGGFVLGAQSGLTRQAKPENVRAIVETAKTYGRYQ